MLILRGGWVLTDPAAGSLLRDGAVRIEAGRVAEAGDAAALIARHPGAEIVGSPDDIVLPGLIDAHSHGRGLSPIQKGVLYDYLENAFLDWSTMAYLHFHAWHAAMLQHLDVTVPHMAMNGAR